MAGPRSGYIGKIPLHRTVLKTAERCAERVCGAKPVSKFTICINLFLNLRKKIQLECSCSHKAIVGYLHRAAGSLKLPLARPRLFRGEIALEDTQIAVLPTTRVSLRRSTHPATRQTIGALNSIDFKFVNPLKISVFLCQSYYVTTPVEPKPRPL